MTRATVLVLVVLAACKGDGGGSYVPKLRGDVDVVYDGPSMDGYNVLSTSIPTLAVQDVSGTDDGGFVAIVSEQWSSVATWHGTSGTCADCLMTPGVGGGGTVSPIRFSSDGRRWKDFAPPSSTWAAGVPIGAYGVGGPDSALVGRGSYSTALGDFPTWRVMRADFADPAFLPDAAYDGLPLWAPHALYGRGGLAGVMGDGLDYVHGAWVRDGGVQAWDLALHAADDSYDLRHVPHNLDFRSTDGLVFEGWSGAVTEGICHVSIRMDGDHLPTSSCYAEGSIPDPFATSIVTHVASVGVVRLTSPGSMDDPAHVAWVGGDGVPTMADLGPGTVADERFGSLHPRYGTWIRVQGHDGPRWEDVRSDGSVVRLDLPDDGPCTNDCPNDLAWLVPLGGDGYLAFYVVDDLSKATHQLVVSRRITAPAVPYTPDDGGGTSPIPAYPDARPGGPLETACREVNACWPRMSWDECLGYWAMFPTEAPGVQRFLAATGRGCAALAEGWAAPQWIGGDCSSGRCQGDVLLTECTQGGLGGQVTKAVDCAALGTTCSTAGLPYDAGACVDGSAALDWDDCYTCTPGGSAVHCWQGNKFPFAEDCGAEGRVCEIAGGQAMCLEPEACTPSVPPAWCEGDDAVSCDAFGRESRLDCPTLYGNACQPMLRVANVECGAEGEVVACAAHQLAPQCVGDFVIWCHGDDVHYVDCKARGFSGCSGSACVP